MTALLSEPLNPQFHDWQRDFEVALRETTQTPIRIQEVQAAIFMRLRAKLANPPGILERIALNDAILFLRLLRSGNVPNVDLDTDLNR